MTNLEKVRAHLGTPELLCQLAEEIIDVEMVVEAIGFYKSVDAARPLQ